MQTKTESNSSSDNKVDNSDTMTIVDQFPGVLRSVMHCKNWISTGEEIIEGKRFYGVPAMCKICRNSEGIFCVSIMKGPMYIATHPGVYKFNHGFYIFRTQDSVFVFERDISLIEDAFCADIDLSNTIYKIKKMQEIRAENKSSLKKCGDIWYSEPSGNESTSRKQGAIQRNLINLLDSILYPEDDDEEWDEDDWEDEDNEEKDEDD